MTSNRGAFSPLLASDLSLNCVSRLLPRAFLALRFARIKFTVRILMARTAMCMVRDRFVACIAYDRVLVLSGFVARCVPLCLFCSIARARSPTNLECSVDTKENCVFKETIWLLWQQSNLHTRVSKTLNQPHRGQRGAVGAFMRRRPCGI